MKNPKHHFHSAHLPQNLNNKKALHFAARNGHHEVVRLLVACPIVSPDVRDHDSATPLDLCRAMELGDWEAVEDILVHPDSTLPSQKDQSR